eukprot:2105432-Alexandrium_andersonii.AAC.1
MGGARRTFRLAQGCGIPCSQDHEMVDQVWPSAVSAGRLHEVLSQNAHGWLGRGSFPPVRECGRSG